MSILLADLRLLYVNSGNRCAFPGCTESLIYQENALDESVNVSNVAHIVSPQPKGPRSHFPLPQGEQDRYGNLVLLCMKHHHIVDDFPQTYTVARLRQIKEDHEKLMAGATEQAVEKRRIDQPVCLYIREILHSTLLPVLQMPSYVYGGPCDYNDSETGEITKKIIFPHNQTELCPFIIRNGMLYSFQNPRYKAGPFRDLVNGDKAQRYPVHTWWDDEDKAKWFTDLLNRTLNKLTGRKNLYLDKEHHRYYFAPTIPGQPLEITYRPLNAATATRQVVWQPVTRRTNKPKRFWYHRAVALRFLRVGDDDWCLSMRPEMRVTKDGITLLDSKDVGRKVTREIARDFNYDLLGDINFWRAYLSNREPRIILSFGTQAVIVSTTMMSTEIEWPGMPEEFRKPFRNVEYPESLFSRAALESLGESGEDEDEWDEYDGE